MAIVSNRSDAEERLQDFKPGSVRKKCGKQFLTLLGKKIFTLDGNSFYKMSGLVAPKLRNQWLSWDGMVALRLRTGGSKWSGILTSDRVTVFPFPDSTDVVHGSVMPKDDVDGKDTISADIFEETPWYLRLWMEGDERVKENTDRYYRKHTFSFSDIGEEWDKLIDLNDPVEEMLINQESAEELYCCLKYATKDCLITNILFKDPLSTTRIKIMLTISCF